MSPVFISSLHRPPTPGVRVMPLCQHDETELSRQDAESMWTRVAEHAASSRRPLLRDRGSEDADSTGSSPPTPPLAIVPMTSGELRGFVRSLSYTSYISPNSDRSDPDSLPELIPLGSPTWGNFEEPLPATQARTADRGRYPPTPPHTPITQHSSQDCSMQQFICFVYRGKAIWLRVSMAMDEVPGTLDVPHVSVQFVTELHGDDPALRRIGLVVERELQDNMQREITSAVRQTAHMQVSDVNGAAMPVPVVV